MSYNQQYNVKDNCFKGRCTKFWVNEEKGQFWSPSGTQSEKLRMEVKSRFASKIQVAAKGNKLVRGLGELGEKTDEIRSTTRRMSKGYPKSERRCT